MDNCSVTWRSSATSKSKLEAGAWSLTCPSRTTYSAQVPTLISGTWQKFQTGPKISLIPYHHRFSPNELFGFIFPTIIDNHFVNHVVKDSRENETKKFGTINMHQNGLLSHPRTSILLCVLLCIVRQVAIGNNTVTIRTFLFSQSLSAQAHTCVFVSVRTIKRHHHHTANFCIFFFWGILPVTE